MALIGNSHQEAANSLHKLERFLAYYGMALNAEKCAYQYRTECPLYRPPIPSCRWGNIPVHHGETSYKYLGFYINLQLDFQAQHTMMSKKLQEACQSFYSRQKMSIKEAITYVNSELISKLRYRMYLVTFPATLLQKFESTLASTVKRLARLPKSTPTDLLINQELLNVHNLQAIIRTDFMQNAMEAPDRPCRITSRISYSHLRHGPLKGVPPFSKLGLASGWREQRYSPLLRGIRSLLIDLNFSLHILEDTRVDAVSRHVADTIFPIAY